MNYLVQLVNAIDWQQYLIIETIYITKPTLQHLFLNLRDLLMLSEIYLHSLAPLRTMTRPIPLSVNLETL